MQYRYISKTENMILQKKVVKKKHLYVHIYVCISVIIPSKHVFMSDKDRIKNNYLLTIILQFFTQSILQFFF